MPLVYRPARAEDLITTDALVVTSINDLTVRHGFGPMAAASAPSFQLFSLKDDPDGLWVAEDGGDILGFGWSWVCGDVWFLAQLFVDPARQGSGIGNELLKRTLGHARKSKAAHKALITFTFNRVSQGLYIRHGLFPKMPIYFFGAARERVMQGLPEPPLRSVAIDDSAATMERLAAIDSRAIGVSREKHHRYLLNDPATTESYSSPAAIASATVMSAPTAISARSQSRGLTFFAMLLRRHWNSRRIAPLKKYRRSCRAHAKAH